MTRRKLNAKIKKHKFKFILAALAGSMISREMFSHLPFDLELQDVVLTGIAFNIYLVSAVISIWALWHVVRKWVR